jgi:acetylornithine aminotransferase
MQLIEREDLMARAIEKGLMIRDAIHPAGLSCVKDVRGCGLMIGVELDCPGKDVFARCLEAGLLMNVTQDRVLRLAPATTVDDADLARGLEILIAAIRGQ